jgi:hypothetical protein
MPGMQVASRPGGEPPVITLYGCIRPEGKFAGILSKVPKRLPSIFLFAICYGLCKVWTCMPFFAQLLSLELLLLGSGAPNYSLLHTL